MYKYSEVNFIGIKIVSFNHLVYFYIFFCNNISKSDMMSLKVSMYTWVETSVQISYLFALGLVVVTLIILLMMTFQSVQSTSTFH